jgi:hypothetical protein
MSLGLLMDQTKKYANLKCKLLNGRKMLNIPSAILNRLAPLYVTLRFNCSKLKYEVQALEIQPNGFESIEELK